MNPAILSIDHNITDFSIAPEPDDFQKEGLKLIATVLRRHMPEIKEPVIYQNHCSIKYEVNFTAKQILNREKTLVEINVTSTFIFRKTEEEPEDDFWCGLILKALEGLIYSYGFKIKDTYLKNSKLAIKKTMKQDCIRQRNMDRVSVNN